MCDVSARQGMQWAGLTNVGVYHIYHILKACVSRAALPKPVTILVDIATHINTYYT